MANHASIVMMVLLAALAPLAQVQARNYATQMNQVRVSANGLAEAVPDLAKLNFYINVQERGRDTVRQKGGEILQRVTRVFLDAGVSEEDIKTDSINVVPMEEWRERRGNDVRSSRILVGFQYTASITVTLRTKELASELAERALSSGGPEVSLSGIYFEFSDITQLEKAARADAMQKAYAYAQVLVEAVGASLGKAVSIVCTNTGGFYQPPMYASMEAGAMMKDSAAPSNIGPVSTGKQSTQASVDVIFEILYEGSNSGGGNTQAEITNQDGDEASPNPESNAA
mmetsp:Transcript_9351/g.16300  ORF Transcript_9351/g.16300 Transcript_9351/m.16300 type:complete len:285 (+) Transcript_9351:391-1245(+)